MTTAAIYTRISSDPDGTMLGVERQRADCEALAGARGWTVGGVYVDNDVSAYSGRRRPEYDRLLEDLASGKVDAVVAWHPDRLHRSPRELEGFIDVVETAGAKVETVQAGSFDLSTPSGRAVARTLGAWARYESEHKAARIARRHEQRALAGAPNVSGTRPFGLSADWSTIIDAEADAIREAVTRVLAGDSLRGICTDWNARGIVTTTGGRWQQAPLRRMLLSPRLAGLRAHNGVIVATGTWPAIIDRPTLERVSAVLTDPGRRTTSNRARSYLLTGFLRCGACGSQLVARPRADHVRRYICGTPPAFTGCGRTFILAEPTEELVEGAVVEVLDSPGFDDSVRARAALAGEPDDAGRVAADESALEDLARDHYVERVISRPEFLTARRALEERIRAGRSRIARATGTTALESVAGSARATWPGLSFDRRRAIIGATLESVTIGPGRRGLNRFDPSRVTVAWKA